MPLSTAGPGSGPERLTTHEAHQRLEQERRSRLAQLGAIEEAAHAAHDHLMSAQRSAVRRVLKEIDAAFDRVRAGTYGACVECGKPIPVERLEILPYARCCVTCQHRTA